MNGKIKYDITIETVNEDEKMAVGNSIHNQLVGNKDYIDSNIILNVDEYEKVRLLIFEECTNVPKITLF